MTSLQIATAVVPDYLRYLFILMTMCGLAFGLVGLILAGLVCQWRNELALVIPESVRAKFLAENIGSGRPLTRKLLLAASVFTGLAALITSASRFVYGMPTPLF